MNRGKIKRRWKPRFYRAREKLRHLYGQGRRRGKRGKSGRTGKKGAAGWMRIKQVILTDEYRLIQMFAMENCV